MALAFTQRLAGDMAGAKVTAERARNTLERFDGAYQDNFHLAAWLSLTYAVMGQKESALKEAERATMFLLRGKDALFEPAAEEHLALIQTIFGENNRAISTLSQLLQTPYNSWYHSPAPITPALLRLDPLWDPLRSDPALQKLCEEKKP